MTRKTLIQSGLAIGFIGIAGAIRIIDGRRKAAQSDASHSHGGVEDAVGKIDARVSEMPSGKQLEYLLDLFHSDDVAGRFAAIERIVERTEPAAIDAVAAAIYDNYSRTRQRALENLHRMDRHRGIPMLYQGLKDDDVWMRETASQQLLTLVGRKGVAMPTGVEAALFNALHDTSVEVRTTASNSLMKQTGNHDPAFRIRMGTPQDAVPVMIKNWEMYLTARKANLDPAILPPKINPTRIDACPDFEFQTIDGKRVSLSGQSGRATLLHFWGTWCGPCRMEMPDLQRATKALQGKPVDVYGLAIAERNGEAGVRAWCKERSIAFPQTLEVDETVHAFNDIVEVPVSILIDAKGKVRYRWDGERTEQTFRASIERVLALG